MKRLLYSTIAILAGCGQAKPTETPTAPTSVLLPAPSRAIHLRAAFDRDPTTYLGRFLPDGIAPEAVDENAAIATSCSKYIRPRVVEAAQDMDESMYLSKQSNASLGFAPIASISGGQESLRAARVRYRVIRKMQGDIDADGLVACCRTDPRQCTGRIIGEFIMGSGSILQVDETRDHIGASGIVPQGANLAAAHDSQDGWRKVNEFENVYFAFLTTATPTPLIADTPTTAADCSWCDTLPQRLDGSYFCGISTEAASEAGARDMAMLHARIQAVKFVSETVVSTSVSRQSLRQGRVEDEQRIAAAAQGIARHVKDEKWCRAEAVPTPEGMRYRTKVLAFIAKSDLESAASLIESVFATAKTMDPEPR